MPHPVTTAGSNSGDHTSPLSDGPLQPTPHSSPPLQWLIKIRRSTTFETRVRHVQGACANGSRQNCKTVRRKHRRFPISVTHRLGLTASTYLLTYLTCLRTPCRMCDEKLPPMDPELLQQTVISKLWQQSSLRPNQLNPSPGCPLSNSGQKVWTCGMNNFV